MLIRKKEVFKTVTDLVVSDLIDLCTRISHGILIQKTTIVK